MLRVACITLLCAVSCGDSYYVSEGGTETYYVETDGEHVIAGGDIGGDPMSNYPPDGWSLSGTGCVWGTDAQVNTVIANRIGDSCVEFLPTTPAGAPVWTLTTPVPIDENRPYKVDAIVQADSIAAGNTVTLRINWYDADKAYLSYDSAYAAVLPSANVWHELSGIFNPPAGARYASPRFTKEKNAFSAYLDWLVIEEVRRSFSAYLSSAQTGVSGGDVIEFDSERYDFGSMFDNVTNYDWLCPATGSYSLQASVRNDAFTPLDDGEYLQVRLYKSTNAWSSSTQLADGTMCWVSANSADAASAVAYTGYFNRGDRVRVNVYHSHGSAISLAGAAATNYSFFAVSEL